LSGRVIEIYENDEWGHGSGEGSLEVHTRGYVSFLQSFLRRKGIASVVDMGCGDWQFSRRIDWSGIEYRGFDVVPSVIAANASRHASANVAFHLYSGDPAQLPAADLLLAKDVLQHLSYAQIFATLACLGRYRYALITNCVAPRGRTRNADIATGDFRYLDLRREPFNLRAKQVYSFAKSMNPIRRLLRGPDWRKSVLLVERRD
jgi:SAM-dependent methyltransferase